MAEKEEDLVEKVSKHLKANNIDPNSLNKDFFGKLVTKLTGIKNFDENELNGFFFMNNIEITNKERYLSAAFLLHITDDQTDLGCLRYYAPKSILVYELKCEVRGSLANDMGYTLNGKKKYNLAKLKRYAVKEGLVNSNHEFLQMVEQAKFELGMIKQRPAKQKKLRKEKPVLELQQEIPIAGEDLENLSEENISLDEKIIMIQHEPRRIPVPDYTPLPKFVPPEPGKKRRQKPKPVYDEEKVKAKVKHFINSGKSSFEITNYLKKETDCSNKEAAMLLEDIAYDSFTDRLWSSKPASRNIINYISEERQKEIALNYIKNNSISDRIGVRRVKATKELLQKYLTINEEAIDSLINKELDNYFEAIFIEHIPIKEQKPDIDYNKPVYATPHIKERARKRIGEDADLEWVLKDIFHSGKTVYRLLDMTPHRIFEFSGELFDIPYFETDEEYILITVFPSTYKNNQEKYKKR